MNKTVGSRSVLSSARIHPAQPIEKFAFDGESFCRLTVRRDGAVSESIVPSQGHNVQPTSDLAAAYDKAWLCAQSLPDTDVSQETVRIVDLFAGCGGMTLGVTEAARALGMACESELAMDTNAAALRVYERNFHCKRVRCEPVESVFGLDESATTCASDALRDLAPVDVLVGGPPCQGHSNLNNHSRRDDAKNALFFIMARAAEILDPEHVIIENVRDIVHDRNGVFHATRHYLSDVLGYRVTPLVVRAEQLGVPQQRHRMFLVATRKSSVDLNDIVEPFVIPKPRSFAWACADLYDCPEVGIYNSSPRRQEETEKRIAWLFDNNAYDLPDWLRPPCHQAGDHTYKSVYGRLHEDRPSQTITTGFSYMGQGRFVHPRLRRTLTPHEAARLQFFPDRFAFGQLKRSEYGYLIGNAVPPKLTYVLALHLLR